MLKRSGFGVYCLGLRVEDFGLGKWVTPSPFLAPQKYSLELQACDPKP